MEVDFEWPCSIRKAHGPHPTPCADCREDGSGDACPNQCPGVPAHPATMAGGSDPKIRKQVDAR